MASPWPIDYARLDELDLDLRNVRIPDADLDQAAIISYMVEAQDVLDLARDILRDGYLDNELPVVVDENGRRVVLEGNRRITALKAILDPALLGTAAPRMERHLSRYPDADTPAEIRVMVAPSRDAAQPLLARLHTGEPKKGWLREQQAVFYHAQLSPAVSVDDLRARYPRESRSKIASFIRMGEMREVIRGLRYKDRALEDFVKTSKLKMTTFEYAYERPGIQNALGLEFTSDGLLVSKRIGRNEARGLIYLLERFNAGTLNTRSAALKATSPEHARLVEEVQRVVAGMPVSAADTDPGSGATGRASGTAPTDEGGTAAGESPNGTAPATDNASSNGAALAGQDGAGGAAGTRGPNRGDTRARLDMDGFDYRGSSAGMRRRFEELRRMDVHDFPNAAYDLLRTVLECSIKDYFATKGQRLTGKTLGPCMRALADAYLTDRRMTSLINAVNRNGAMPAGQYSGTSLALNSANHEPDSFAGSREVHEAWERIKPILIEIVGTSVQTPVSSGSTTGQKP